MSVTIGATANSERSSPGLQGVSSKTIVDLTESPTSNDQHNTSTIAGSSSVPASTSQVIEISDDEGTTPSITSKRSSEEDNVDIRPRRRLRRMQSGGVIDLTSDTTVIGNRQNIEDSDIVIVNVKPPPMRRGAPVSRSQHLNSTGLRLSSNTCPDPQGRIYFQAAPPNINIRKPQPVNLAAAILHRLPQRSPSPPAPTLKCAICLSTPSPLVSTICGHLFCEECLKEAMKQSGKKCPTCRKNIPAKKGYHAIYF
ncbi:hypothetical protein BKA69DRAFT_312240 [Paraphysoderma sedebokerense]|nr:hypothetical protein BKA69DRAFT_312240 [Paraphysoderma sedebokerense]